MSRDPHHRLTSACRGADPACPVVWEGFGGKPLMIDMVVHNFRIALAELMQRDRHLLDYDVAERAITHKLGTYLQPLFPEWDVDCEYNRNGHDPKTVRLPARSDSQLLRETSTYPDIIVHKRGSNDSNLLIVEAKKIRCSQRAHEFDRRKVEAYARDLYYQAGILIKIPTGRNRRVPWHCELYYQGAWTDLHPT